MANLILPGDANQADVKLGKKFSAGINYNALGALDLSLLIPSNIKLGVVISGVTGTYGAYTAGDNVQYSSAGITLNNYNQWLVLSSTQVAYAGTIRVKWTAVFGGGLNFQTQIYVNGVARGINHTITSTQSFSEDITINAGDYVQIYGFNPNQGGSCSISAISICTAENSFGIKVV